MSRKWIKVFIKKDLQFNGESPFIEFCSTWADTSCASLVVSTALATSAFRFASAYAKSGNSMPLTNSYRCNYALLRIQALGLCLLPKGSNALKEHSATKLPELDIELLDFRSKFLGLVPENLCTKIHTNSNRLRWFFSFFGTFFLFLFAHERILRRLKQSGMPK